MRKYLLIAIILSMLITMTGCCLPGDDPCYATWYGIEADPERPGVYHNKLDLWINETFGKDSGWERWWTKTFGGEEEYEARFGSTSNLQNRKAVNIDEFNEIAERIKDIE
jgi:hypothetical protein